MSGKTAIQWADATWSPVYGCTKVSPGCSNCYIERTPPYRTANPPMRFERGRIPVQLKPERLDVPLRWRKPRRIFVNSLSDTFHEDVPDEFLDRMFGVMGAARQHTFLVLTKRPERMRRFLTSVTATGAIWPHYMRAGQAERCLADSNESGVMPWPLPNVWLGVTAENQRMADERIPVLLDTPAARRFVSVEPMLGAVDLRGYFQQVMEPRGPAPVIKGWQTGLLESSIDWVIAGGESAGPEHRRLVEECCRKGTPFGPRQRNPHQGHFDPKDTVCPYYNRGECDLSDWSPKPHGLLWARSLRDQCNAAGVAFHFKQWGGPTPKSAGRLLDGREWDEVPA